MQTFRTNVVLPRSIVREIDKVIGKRQRSNFLAEAAAEKLDRMRFDKALRKSFGSWGDAEHPELRTHRDMQEFLRGMRRDTEKRIKSRLSE